MAKQKSWREKLADPKDLPKLVPLTGKAGERWGTGTMAIPTPLEVDAIMRSVPPGRLITMNEVRDRVAAQHDATVACPLTSGIFAWMAAHAAEEAAAEGETDVTPYWRTLKSGGELNPKYPGGIERQRERLEAEGHRVVPRGKRWIVADYQARIRARHAGE